MPLVKKCTGTVSGVVTDAVSGLPIANASISVGWPIKTLDVKTNAQGEFTYPGVLLGYNNTPPRGASPRHRPATSSETAKFPMNACGDAREVEIAMALAPPPTYGTLEGHVYDAVTSDPIVGAFVHTPICALPPGTTCTTTDANGFYRLQNVPLISATGPRPGRRSSPTPTRLYYGAVETFDMTANKTTVHDFVLSRKKYARLTGVVTDRFSGEPIAGAVGGRTTRQRRRDDRLGRPLPTRPIELPSPGDPTALTFEFGAAGLLAADARARRSRRAGDPFELNFDLLPICEDATSRGSVRQRDHRQPIEGAEVVATGNYRTFTDADGFYKLEHLRVGDEQHAARGRASRSSPPASIRSTKTVTIFCNASLTLGGGRPAGDDHRPEGHATSRLAETFDLHADVRPRTSTWPTARARRSAGLLPGSGYSVAETVPAGWKLAGAIVLRRQPGRRTST